LSAQPGATFLEGPTTAATDANRIVISCAAGRVAYALIFRIANGGLFAHDRPVALSLHDLSENLPRLDAYAMESKESAFPLLIRVQTGSDPVRAFEAADWMILLGSLDAYARERIRQNIAEFDEEAAAVSQLLGRMG
jgi:malate dehydrogenase